MSTTENLTIFLPNASQFKWDDIQRSLNGFTRDKVILEGFERGGLVASVASQEGLARLRAAFDARIVRIKSLLLLIEFPENNNFDPPLAPIAEPIAGKPTQDKPTQSGNKRDHDRITSSPTDTGSQQGSSSSSKHVTKLAKHKLDVSTTYSNTATDEESEDTVQSSGRESKKPIAKAEETAKYSGDSKFLTKSGERSEPRVQARVDKEGTQKQITNLQATLHTQSKELAHRVGENQYLKAKMVEFTTTVGKLSEDLEISRKETLEVLLKNHDLERQVEQSKLRESKSTAQNVELSGSLDSVKADRNSLAAQLESVRCQAVQTASIEVQTEYMPPLKEDRPEPPPAVHPILTRQDTRDPYSFVKSVRIRLDGMMEKTAIERVAITSSLHHTDDNLIDIIHTAVFREEALCPVSRLLEVAKLAHQSRLKQLVEECLEFYILFALEDWHAIWFYGFCEDLSVRRFSDQLKIICARGMSALFNNWAWGQFSPLCPLQEGKAKLKAWSLFQVSKFASHQQFTTRHKWVILIAWVKAQQGLADVNPRGGMRGLNAAVARQMIHGVNHLLAEGLVTTGGPCRFFTEHVEPYLPLISSQDRYKNALRKRCQKAALQLLAAE